MAIPAAYYNYIMATHLKIGDPAPSFEGINQEGKNIKLSDFKGKTLVLYFYPKDLTPGCTLQACSLRDAMADFANQDIAVLGVSADPVSRHQRFITKYDLNFDLIADESRNIIEQFGVWGPKNFMGKRYDGINRSTFIIDPQGRISHIIEKVKTKSHAAQIKELLEK